MQTLIRRSSSHRLDEYPFRIRAGGPDRCFDFFDRNDEAERDLSSWLASGQLKVVEDVIDGLENAPRGLIGLLAGENRGKRMIRVGPDPR